MADFAVRVHTIHTSHGYVVMGKYHVVSCRRGFAVRDITTGEYVEVFVKKWRALLRAEYMNKGVAR